jgi:hypothetical protein
MSLIRDEIDLHGLTLDEALPKLDMSMKYDLPPVMIPLDTSFN